MPCMGPTPPSETEVNQITEDILDMLKTKYKIFSFDPGHPFNKTRVEVIEKLKKTVYSIVEQDGFENF